MSFMSVQCSIFEGKCKSLQESQVKALQGNAALPTPAFLVVSFSGVNPDTYSDIDVSGYDYPFMPDFSTSPSPSKPYTSGWRHIVPIISYDAVEKPTYMRSKTDTQWDMTYGTTVSGTTSFTDVSYTNAAASSHLESYLPGNNIVPRKAKIRICGPTFGVVAYYQLGVFGSSATSEQYTSAEYVEIPGSYYNKEENSYAEFFPPEPTYDSGYATISGVVFWFGLTSASQIPIGLYASQLNYVNGSTAGA